MILALPGVLYAFALVAYVAVAGVILLWALALLLSEKTKPKGLRMAAGILVSFPGVFAFQMLSLPAVFLNCIPAFIGIAIANRVPAMGFGLTVLSALQCFLSFAFASLYGFIVGWRLGANLTDEEWRRELRHNRSRLWGLVRISLPSTHAHPN